MPLFAVIIPTYNRAHLLARAIESVIAQTWSDWELIVVDDGSTDNTEELISEYLVDHRIRFVKQENKGVSAARNFGASQAEADYLAFLDSDDQFKNNYLSEIVKHLHLKDKPEIIFVGVDFMTGNLLNRKVSSRKPYGSPSDNGVYLAGAFVISKTLFWKIGGYDVCITYGENTEFFYKLAPLNVKKEFVEDELLVVNQNVNSRTSNSPINLITSTQYILEKHKDYFAGNKRVERLLVQVLGVSFLRLNKFKEARKYLFRAYLLNPFKLLTLLRLTISYIPILSKKIYKINNH